MSCSLSVIIPAYNEEQSLPLVLTDLRSALEALPPGIRESRVLVVDNASTDRTALVGKEHGALVLHEPQRGYGGACLCGIGYLRSLEPPLEQNDIIVFLDADYSDYPSDLSAVIEPILSGRAELVIGSRLVLDEQRNAVPLVARFGNRFAMQVLRLLYGVQYTDMGPFRAITWGALAALGMEDRTWGWTLEMQLKAARLGVASEEVAVRYRERAHGRSKISQSLVGATRASAKILWVLSRHVLACSGQKYSNSARRR